MSKLSFGGSSVKTNELAWTLAERLQDEIDQQEENDD